MVGYTNDLYLVWRRAPEAEPEITHFSFDLHGMSVSDLERRVKASDDRRSQGKADTITVHTRTLSHGKAALGTSGQDTGEEALGISANITEEDTLAEKHRGKGTSKLTHAKQPGGILSKESKLYSSEVEALKKEGFTVDPANVHTVKAGQMISPEMITKGRRLGGTYVFILPRGAQSAYDQVYLASKGMMAGRRPLMGQPLGNDGAFKAGQPIEVRQTRSKGRR